MKTELDAQDKRLVTVLAEDAEAPLARLAERLQVTAPTVRTRMRALMHKGVLKLASLIDPFQVKGLTLALVCITVKSHEQLGVTLDQVAALDRVSWAAIVTGRYDIVCEVVLSEEISDLYKFLDEDLSSVGGISTSESFVVMQARGKWVSLPEGTRRRFLGA